MMRLAFGFALLLATASEAAAQEVPNPALKPADPPAVVRTATDADNRVTIPVSIGDKGPYSFVIDTGSQRTVVSRELATSLALAASQPIRVLSMTGIMDVDTVTVPGIRFGSTRMDDVQAPVFEGEHLGAPGLLGLDGLHRKRVVLNFRTGRMSITSSQAPATDTSPDMIVVTARNRAGQLILMDSQADGAKVQVVVDTGTEYSVGNMALLKMLKRRNPNGFNNEVSMVSVTGGRLTGPWGTIGHLKMGDLTMVKLPVMFAEANPFAELGLTDKPAIMLGVSALRMFDRVAIDFGRKRVDFILPDEGSLPRTQMAAAELP